MGSGSSSSSKKVAQDPTAEKYRAPAAPIVTEEADQPRRPTLRQSGTVDSRVSHSMSMESIASGPSLKPCDGCGETRKCTVTVKGEWHCMACNLGGELGGRISPMAAETEMRKARKMHTLGEQLKLEGPKARPVAKASSTPLRRAQTFSAQNSSYQSEGKEQERDKSEEASSPKPARRRGKCKDAQAKPKQESTEARPRLNSDDSSASFQVQRGVDMRGLAGLNAMREARDKAFSSGADEDEGDEPKSSAGTPSGKLTLPPPTAVRELVAGFKLGDKVQSLLSCGRHGLQLVQVGQEGTLAGCYVSSKAGFQPRLLVQFQRGLDWWLTPSQVASPVSFPAVRNRELAPGLTWGSRVRSLMTYLHPSGAGHSHEVWLGEEGTVIGPGAMPGKIAIRFDTGQGEWSIWPSLVCKSEAYAILVAEKLSGRLSRGDRVKSKGGLKGHKGEEGEVQYVKDGEEGTVIGPGHSPERLLVHFDSDDRVWSVLPVQISAVASCI